MKFHLKGSISLIAALLTLAGFSYSAKAADTNAYLYIAHAASGRNISPTTNPEYPVDLSVNGVCVAKGLSFGDIPGPFTGSAGTYSLKAYVSSVAFPCSGTAVFTATVALQAGNAYLGILTLNGTGLQGMLFRIDLSVIPPGIGRLAVFNATQQDLSATLTAVGGGSSTINISAGHVSLNAATAGHFTGTVHVGSEVFAGPVPVEVSSRNLYMYVLAGSTANHSVQIIGPRVIRDVF